MLEAPLPLPSPQYLADAVSDDCVGAEYNVTTGALEVFVADTTSNHSIEFFEFDEVTEQRGQMIRKESGPPFLAHTRPWWDANVSLVADAVSLAVTATFALRCYSEAGAFIGVAAVDLPLSAAQEVVAKMVPIASSSAGRALIVSNTSQLLMSSHPLMLPRPSGTAPLPILDAAGLAACNDTTVAAGVSLLLSQFQSFATAPHDLLVSTPDYIVSLQRLPSNSNNPDVPWFAIAILPVNSVLPSFAVRAGGTVLITVGSLLLVVGLSRWLGKLAAKGNNATVRPPECVYACLSVRACLPCLCLARRTSRRRRCLKRWCLAGASSSALSYTWCGPRGLRLQ